jgi:hypothetical protein
MKSAKKYKIIAKIGNDKFVKYNVNNLVLFTEFLDKKFSDWRWFNVFEYTKNDSGTQLGSFTKNKRPNKNYL